MRDRVRINNTELQLVPKPRVFEQEDVRLIIWDDDDGGYLEIKMSMAHFIDLGRAIDVMKETDDE